VDGGSKEPTHALLPASKRPCPARGRLRPLARTSPVPAADRDAPFGHTVQMASADSSYFSSGPPAGVAAPRHDDAPAAPAPAAAMSVVETLQRRRGDILDERRSRMVSYLGAAAIPKGRAVC